VCAAAGFHADFATAFDFPIQKGGQLIARQALAQYGVLIPINAVQLEHLLCQIDTNAHKLHGGLLLH
jgi:hypothetical protein